jgi:signal transduction histidine kinase/CheY-like chemotaxis protein
MQISRLVEQLADKQQYIIQFSMREKDGSVRRKEMRYSYADKEAGLIAFSRRDVEDMVQAEKRKQEMLERARDTAERASSAKSEFLSRMSHEMRTPMNAITGLVALAEREVDKPAAIRDYLEKISVSSHHLLNLINDVLDMSKIENGELKLKPAACRYDSLIEETAMVIRPLCRQKKIDFLEENQKVDATLYTDKLRFKQVLMNILSNAVKFTPEGGNISFSSKAVTQNGFLCVDYEIADTGIGMSPEFQKDMFRPFTQEQRGEVCATQGTGLGLTISKAIMDQMAGTLRVISSLDEGTQFFIHVEFPLAMPGQMAPAVERRRRRRGVSLCGKRVLLVEDHPMNQMIAKRILQNSGVKVVTANNGQECLDMIEQSEPGYFDAILMDIRMPVMDGLTAARHIRSMEREDCKRIPIVAMTANAFEEDVRKTMEAGMNAHLAKPMEPAVMMETLADCIARNAKDSIA